MKAKVEIYTSSHSVQTRRIKKMLKQKGVNYSEHRVKNRQTQPQIFINDRYIGNYDDLQNLAKNGRLDKLLNQEQQTFQYRTYWLKANIDID